MASMFEVDRKGLAQILTRRGVQFAVLELIQNALDEEGVTKVDVALYPSPTRGYYQLTVTDDAPDGFADLSHAYTLFASSKKKDNPEQRGRFNLGEKLVLACSRSATIRTTKGSVIFENDERRQSSKKTDFGSTVSVEIKMTREEAAETEKAVRSVIVPSDIQLCFNTVGIKSREPVGHMHLVLATERADEEGYLRSTQRKTSVYVHEVREGEKPTLYEMGIPVVELDCAWHIDVGQKVPLNMDRDNVTPSYKRDVLTAVVNLMHEKLTAEQAKAPWVSEAMEDPDITSAAVNTVLTARYGDKRVIADPSDPEGTKIAVTQGYAVIPAGSYSKAQWDSIRRSGAALPAGQVTPSPKPFSAGGRELKTLKTKKEGHRHFEHYAICAATWLLGVGIDVVFASDIQWGFGGAFGPSKVLYVSVLRRKHWFEGPMTVEILAEIDAFLIHEFAHLRVSDHLSSKFHEECCRLGAKLARAVREDKLSLSMFSPEVPFG